MRKKYIINIKGFSLLELLIAAYLLDVGYIASVMSFQRLTTWLLVILYIILNIDVLLKIFRRADTDNNKLIITSICWLLFIILTPFFHGTGDYSYLSTLITMTGSLLNMVVILIICNKHTTEYGELKDSFMHMYMYINVMYVMFTTLCIISPAIRDAVIKNIYIPPENLFLIRIEKYATRIGWAGFSGYNSSIKCAIANLFSLYYILRGMYNGKKIESMYVLMYFITLLGEFYYSRTGLIVSVAILALFYVYTLRKRSVLSFIGSVFLVLGIFIFVPSLQLIAENNRSVAWIFEPVLNFFSDDGFTSTSSEHLLKDMIFEINSKTLLLGDGRYTGERGYYMKTDIGFMRLILYFGIFGAAITYRIVFLCLKRIKANSSEDWEHFFYYTLLISFAAFEFKGESIPFLIPLFMVFALSVSNKKKENYEKNVIID